ncbi:MAG: trehalase family glycosidase, partial [Candidatus Neomarinimicrobiota bacterium]
LPVLEKYVEWLETNRVKASAKHGLYWQNGLGSGMDNTPQTGSAWVEMSAQMVIQYNDLAFMAEEIDLPEKAYAFRVRAKSIADKINRLMWVDSAGFYWNLDDDNAFQKCQTIGFSWTMLAGIPSTMQAKRLAENLMNPDLFYRYIPFASLSAASPGYNPHGGYWLGSSWAPTTYQAIKGLERYGYEEFAAQASEKYLAGMYAVFQKTGTVWENYAPDFPEPGDNSRKDFVGWSACGPIALLIENIIGLRPDVIHNQITWHLHRTDRHGIENLVIGKTTLSLLCEKRQIVEDPAVLTLTTDRPFQLIVIHPKGQKTIDLKSGVTRVTVNPS